MSSPVSRERREQLPEKALRDFAADQAVAFRPGVFRKIVGSEQPIDEREMDGEVDIHRLLVRRMMPVVIAHGHEIRLQPDRPRSKVGVAERRVKGHEDEISGQRGLRETEDRHRDEDQPARQQDVHVVRARSRHPIHRFDGVMDRMKAPQEWNRVKRPVRGVLREIRDDNRQRKLDEKRQGPHRLRKPWDRQPPGRVAGRDHHPKRDELCGQMRGHKVEEVRRPLRPKRLLVRMQRPESFHRQEGDRHHEQIQQKPIQTEAEFRVDFVRQRRASAADDRRQKSQRHAGDGQHLALPQDARNGAQHDRKDDGSLNQQPDDRHGIVGARIGKREQPGKMQTQRAAEAEQAEKDRMRCRSSSRFPGGPAPSPRRVSRRRRRTLNCYRRDARRPLADEVYLKKSPNAA